MSKDLNIERSSTRLHHAPGGQSSISFGDYKSSPVKKNKTSSFHEQVAVPHNKENVCRGQQTTEAPPAPRMRKASGHANMEGSAMANLLGSDDSHPVPVVRRRQAPGGNSSIVIG